MLLEHWNEIAARHRDDIAFWHHGKPSGITFGEIDSISRTVDTSSDTLIAIGTSLAFFPTLIAAWRTRKPVILAENEQSKIRPIRGNVPAGTVLIKQTCGASGIERSLFFDEAAVLAEGLRNLSGLGLHRERRGLAAISLAHSYGFGCLALPLLLRGIPLDIAPGPMPMFLNPALERGGPIFLPGVPAIWKTWWQTGITSHPAISLALSAGSPLSLKLEQAIHASSNLKIHNFYGTSETGAIAFDASHTPRSTETYLGTCLPGITVDCNHEGYLTVRSDAQASGSDLPVFPGEFTSGTYRTWDLGHNSAGEIHLTRCTGAAINVAGRKVSPARLEKILRQLPGVSTARISRAPSRDFERLEEIHAHLGVSHDYDKKALREELRKRIESWEMPRHWDFQVNA
ncbi:AMP-binding protein [Luteolibacter algae]|uniref:AMP-binding protein n=1 Tax=Luteolibacter algae TaxID=454151 RepID=A0ABW5D7V1_9BACT